MTLTKRETLQRAHEAANTVARLMDVPLDNIMVMHQSVDQAPGQALRCYAAIIRSYGRMV